MKDEIQTVRLPWGFLIIDEEGNVIISIKEAYKHRVKGGMDKDIGLIMVHQIEDGEDSKLEIDTKDLDKLLGT